MSTNGGEPHTLDVRTADLGDPASLREVLISIDETGKAAIGGGFHMAEELRNFRAESAAQHRDIIAKVQALAEVFGPRLEALSEDVRKGFDSVAAELRTHQRAFDAALSIESLAREETDKGIMAEVGKVNRRVVENRRAINTLTGPDTPDLAEVTKVQNIPALVKAQLTEHTLEITKAQLGELKTAEAKRLEARAERVRYYVRWGLVVLAGVVLFVAGRVWR